MHMAKPSEQDIEAADELHQILMAIDTRGGGPWPTQGPKDLPAAIGEDEFGWNTDDFDADDPKHLQGLYNHLAKLLRHAPNFYGRVLGGMCHVICWDKNRILDPNLDYLELHPDILAGLKLLAEAKAAGTWLDRLARDAQAAVDAHVEKVAAQGWEALRARWAAAGARP